MTMREPSGPEITATVEGGVTIKFPGHGADGGWHVGDMVGKVQQ